MQFQPPRPSPALTGMLAAAGLVLAAASCTSHLTPLGPTPPQPRHLGSAIILQAMRSHPRTPAGGCPAGWVALSVPGSPLCYRKFDAPVTITSAVVASIPSTSPQPATPQYGFMITVPAGDVAAVTAIIRQAYDARGVLAISVAGKTWSAPEALAPFPGRQFEIVLPSRNQALRLRHILIPSR